MQDKKSGENVVKQGYLRKKGKVFYNPRHVVLTSRGEL